MNLNQFTVKAQEAVVDAQAIAVKRNHQSVEALGRVGILSRSCQTTLLLVGVTVLSKNRQSLLIVYTFLDATRSKSTQAQSSFRSPPVIESPLAPWPSVANMASHSMVFALMVLVIG